MKNVEIYTDGACSGNPGPGGWGAILCYGGHEKEIHGGHRDTTNNKMELQAVIEALNLLKERCQVTVYTDSKYVMDGALEWMANWKKRGWKTANKKDVKNSALWKELDKALTHHDVSWQWVKGHSGHVENERADALARKFYEEMS